MTQAIWKFVKDTPLPTEDMIIVGCTKDDSIHIIALKYTMNTKTYQIEIWPVCDTKPDLRPEDIFAWFEIPNMTDEQEIYIDSLNQNE